MLHENGQSYKLMQFNEVGLMCEYVFYQTDVLKSDCGEFAEPGGK